MSNNTDESGHTMLRRMSKISMEAEKSAQVWILRKLPRSENLSQLPLWLLLLSMIIFLHSENLISLIILSKKNKDLKMKYEILTTHTAQKDQLTNCHKQLFLRSLKRDDE